MRFGSKWQVVKNGVGDSLPWVVKHWSGCQPEWLQVVVDPSGEALAVRNREDVQTVDNPPPKRRRLWTKTRVIDGQPQLCTD